MNSNFLFLLYLLCSFSTQIQLEKSKQFQEQQIKKSNIYLGASGTVQEFLIGNHDLLKEFTNDRNSPVYTFDYMAKAGDTITISVKDTSKVKGISLSLIYLDSSNNTQLYSTNDIDWTCNGKPAEATGKIGNNGKWGRYIGFLFGLPSIWSPDNEEFVTCSALLPIHQKVELPNFQEIQRNILTDNIKIYSDQISSLKINGNEMVFPTENDQGKIQKFSYDIKEGDSIEITLIAKEGKEPGFGGIIEFENPYGIKETITTGDDWICDGESPIIKGEIGDQKYPVDDKEIEGVTVIWGDSPGETTCEFVIPIKTKNLKEEGLEIDENHEPNIIFSVDDTLTEFKVNNENYVQRIEAGLKIKKMYIPLKEGDQITVSINNQFGGYKGFAGIFTFETQEGLYETLKTDEISWKCDGMKPKVIETIGEGIFWNEWKPELEGVKTIWGKNMHRETTCTAKLQLPKGGILVGVDPELKAIEINGQQVDLSEQIVFKDYSDLKVVETRINYGDEIAFICPKGETIFASKIVGYRHGKPNIFYSSKLNWNCEELEIEKEGTIGEGTFYDINWANLGKADLLHIKSNKEVKCKTLLVKQVSNIYIGSTAKIKEIKINDNVADLSLVEGIDNVEKVKKLNANLKEEDVISITVEKTDTENKDCISSMILLNLGGSSFVKFASNEYYWDCTGVSKPYNYGGISENDPAEWKEFLNGSTKIFGSQISKDITCKIKLSMKKSSITVAGLDGIVGFFVNDEYIKEKEEYLSTNFDEIKKFDHLLQIGDKIAFAAKMKNKESSIAAKIIIPIKGDSFEINTNSKDWICNDNLAESKGFVSSASENYNSWVSDLDGVEAIGSSKKDDFLMCSTTIQLFKSVIAFSAKDKVNSILVNNKAIDLNGLALDDYKQIKYVYVLLNQGDEVKIISEKTGDSWNGIIASIAYKPGSPEAKKYYTDDSWICGCCYNPQIISNDDVTHYWQPYLPGAKAIWEKESEIEHKKIGCRTTLR